MIYLKPVNKLMTTSEKTTLAPSPQPSTNLWVKKSVSPVWIRPAENLLTHPRNFSVSINSDPLNAVHASKKQQKKA